MKFSNRDEWESFFFPVAFKAHKELDPIYSAKHVIKELI